MQKVINKGFTLIELLVVIAIIGILAGIVLVSLNSARNKGKDTRVIADVQQARNLLESGYNTTTGVYADLTGTASTNPAAGALVAAGPNNANLATLASDATTQGGSLSYKIGTNATANPAANATAYAVYGNLASTPGTYFCIDSTGKTNSAAANNTNATCP